MKGELPMIDRRHAIRLTLAALPAAWLCATAQAAGSFQRFFPFLVDLPGWTGGKPDGMSMEMPNNNMVTAKRDYEHGSARLSAQIIIGPAAKGALAVTHSGIRIETGDSRMSTSTIDGLPVTRTFTISNKSGAIIVALGTSAMFNVSFNGISDDEALALAKKFDWKAMQAAVK
jgi:hypothetical protein